MFWFVIFTFVGIFVKFLLFLILISIFILLVLLLLLFIILLLVLFYYNILNSELSIFIILFFYFIYLFYLLYLLYKLYLSIEDLPTDFFFSPFSPKHFPLWSYSSFYNISAYNNDASTTFVVVFVNNIPEYFDIILESGGKFDKVFKMNYFMNNLQITVDEIDEEKGLKWDCVTDIELFY